jgi:hypothetical protein
VERFKGVFVIMGKGGGRHVASDCLWREAANRLSCAIFLCEADGKKYYDYWHQSGGAKETAEDAKNKKGTADGRR